MGVSVERGLQFETTRTAPYLVSRLDEKGQEERKVNEGRQAGRQAGRGGGCSPVSST